MEVRLDLQYIYGLFDDSTGQMVYVGITNNPFSRLGSHLKTTAFSFKDRCRMEILEFGPDVTLDDEAFWINYSRFLGCSLLNKYIPGKLPASVKSERRGPRTQLEFLMRERGIRVVDVWHDTKIPYADICNARMGRPVKHKIAARLQRYFKKKLGADVEVLTPEPCAKKGSSL